MYYMHLVDMEIGQARLELICKQFGPCIRRAIHLPRYHKLCHDLPDLPRSRQSDL